MNNLSISAFIIPAIALLLVIAGHIILLKRTTNKLQVRNFFLKVIAFAMLFNFAWEMLQMPLFENMPLTWQTTLFCGLASVADVIMVLLIYYGFAFIYRDPFWIQQSSLIRIILIMLVGGIGAVLAELRHLSLGSWQYSEKMPLLPWVNVGLSPVLQFMLLPPLIYFLSYRFVAIKKRRQSK